MKVTERESPERIGESRKALPRQPEKRVYPSDVSGEQLVSLDGVLPTQDRTLTRLAASCFLSKDGCRGSGRAAEEG